MLMESFEGDANVVVSRTCLSPSPHFLSGKTILVIKTIDTPISCNIRQARCASWMVFMEIPVSESSPIFSIMTGLSIVIGFAFILGFGATLAEPALNALGSTVQTLTNGAFKKSMLMYSVAGGVAVGIALGVSKVVLGFDLMKVLLPLYVLGIVLTVFSTEEFVNVAWDSAGVTTGPVTVPLVLAMGLGLGNAVSAIDGFGILSLASICPIVAVLSMGLVIKFINNKTENTVAV